MGNGILSGDIHALRSETAVKCTSWRGAPRRELTARDQVDGIT